MQSKTNIKFYSFSLFFLIILQELTIRHLIIGDDYKKHGVEGQNVCEIEEYIKNQIHVFSHMLKK